MDIIFRPARREDCPRVGELVCVAGHGLAEYLLDGLVPDRTAAQLVAHDLAENPGERSFRNVIVAEAAGKVKGMAFSYDSRHHRLTDGMRRFIPAGRIKNVDSFYSTRSEDSLYLDTLAVDEDLRGSGVGGRLIELCKQKARDMGLGSLSLIVFAGNHGAISLYRRHGFEDVRKIPVQGPDSLKGDGAAMLMECKLAAG